MVNSKVTAPRLATIDLNLLTVFDAIMKERSTTRAGKTLGLSQPATSHALARLRHMLHDELFVRGPQGMMPTPRAEQLAAPIRAAMLALQEALEPDVFEPAKASMTFTIAVDNYAAIVLVAPIVADIAKIAPNVRLDFRPSGTLNVIDQLDRNELQLVIGQSDISAERLRRRRLARDEFVLVMRRHHPLSRNREISPEAFATAAQLDISSARFGTDISDEVNSTKSKSRAVVVRAPVLSAARILATSDLVAVLPMQVAQEMTRNRDLEYRRLIRAPRSIESTMIWLRRLDNNAAHAWLRDEIAKAVQPK